MARKHTIKFNTEGEVEMHCEECGARYYLSSQPENGSDYLCEECLYK